MYPFIHIGPLTLGTYGILVATGLVCGFFVLRADLARRGISADAEAIVGITGLAGLAGSRLYYVFQNWAEFHAHPRRMLFSTMGFTWYGAVIGGFLALLFLARHFRMPLLLMLDVVSTAAALGYGIGRIGCLISGDGDYGIPTSLPWGMSFPNGIDPTYQRVHPTPIYEFLGAVVISWILWRLGARLWKAHAPDGRVFGAYLVLTGIARFLVEFIRRNPPSFYGFTNAQVASAVSIIAGIILFVSVRNTSSAPRRA